MIESKFRLNISFTIDELNIKKLNKENINDLTENGVENENIRAFDCSHNYIRDISKLCVFQRIEGLIANHCTIVEIPKNINNLINLTFINLSNNSIKNLENCIFDLKTLESLDISNNNISVISKLIGNLKNLRFLSFSGNLVEILPEEIGDISGLNSLDCSYNLLKSLPNNIGKLIKLRILLTNNNKLTYLPEVLQNLQHLEIFQIGNNFLTFLPESFFNLFSLLELNLSNNKLKWISDEIGKIDKLIVLNLSYNNFLELPSSIGKLSNLKYLNLRGNSEISSLPGSILLAKSLSELLIDQCNFSSLQDDFGYVHNLRILNFSDNKISELPIDFKNCQSLAVLKWTNNCLTLVPPLIGSLNNLQVLDLSKNGLSALPDEMEYMETLKKIDLSYNKFTTFPVILTKISTLNCIELVENEIEYLPKCIDGMGQLKNLNLTNNKLKIFPYLPSSIENVNCSYNSVESFPEDFPVLTKLTSLDLSQTQFDAIPGLVFSFTSLKRFVYNQKEGKKFGDLWDQLDRLIDLEEIDLSNNILTKIPNQIVKLKKLTNINLSGNMIKIIEPDFIYEFRETLRSLDLSKNLIEVLPSTAFAQFKQLNVLNLHGNPWKSPPNDVVNGGKLIPICSFLKALQEIDAAVLNQIMPNVSEHFPKDRIRHLFRKLKIPEDVITELEATYRGKFNQKLLIAKGLDEWRKCQEDNATADSLINCFFLINERKLSRELIKMKAFINRIKL